MMGKNSNHKIKRLKKQRSRRTLTFMRMVRYGVNNFSRNAWLTIAATAVMSVTLLIIFTTVAAREVLLGTVNDLSDKVDFSIYLKSDVESKQADELKQRIEKIDNVRTVRYVSAAEAREQFARENKADSETLEALKEATNRFPATLRVSLVNVNNTNSLDSFVKDDELYKKIRDDKKDPSFAGERRQSIKTITDWIGMASVGGAIATVVFVTISSLVVFNTIRMAIFNRKDEIQMMKLIGAGRGFIRGPFVVEAVMYGFIAALVATGVGYGLVAMAEEPLSRAGLPVTQLLEQMITYIGFITLGMIVLGASIGVISSLIATRKYLKI